MDGRESQFTKPRRHTFMYVVIVFVVLVVVSFYVLVHQGPKTDQDVIQSIQDEYSNEATKGSGAFAAGDGQVDVVSPDDPYFGDPDAPITIVEFGDFECPFCKRSVESVKALEAAFGKRIFFQFRDFPLVSIHEQALNAALAAECAHDQGEDYFWAYHDRLYQFQDELSDDLYVPLAERVGLDVERFEQCYTESTYVDEIQSDYDSGLLAGVEGTPTFFINGYRVTGVIPPETFVEIINSILETQ